MSVENEHFVAEGLSIVDDAQEQGLKLRILGSLAYRIHCPTNLAMFDAMERALYNAVLSGVSLDEEMADLLKYQRSFQASSRVFTVIDDLLDNVVNRMGI